MRAPRLLAPPCLALVGAGLVQPPAAAAETLVVQSAVGVTPEAERILAELAEPRRLILRPSQDRVELARRLCGRLTPTYLELLSRANAGGSPGVAVIPACFEVRTNERLSALPGESLPDFARRWVGLAGPKTLAAIKSANSRLRLNRFRSFDWAHGPVGAGPGEAITISEVFASEAAGETPTLVVPFRTEPVAYTLRGGMDAEAAAATLARALNADPALDGLPTPKDEIEIESGVEAQFRGPALCPTPPPGEAAAWPFSVEALLGVLRRNDAVRADNGFDPPAAAAVAVVDNGVDGLFSLFPREDLAINRAEYLAPQPGGDEDGNGYYDDIAGTNVFGGPPLPQAPKDPEHGTLMAGLVLGGPQFRSAAAAAGLRRRVQFRAVSLLKTNVSPSPQGNVTTFTMPLEALTKAVEYSQSSQIWTLSMSVSARMKPVKVEELLFNNPNLLLVVASGNRPLPLDFGATRYPAAFSSQETGQRGKVMTVGSHDRRGCFSAFAGMGPETVDLAAPGEAITSTGMGGSLITSEGTSQATALVSFVSALLRYEGLMSASAVKDRLIASVDLQPHLAALVRSQGALNMVKALSVNDDVLQLKADPGRLRFGKLLDRPDLAGLCPDWLEPGRARLLKISRRVDGGDPAQIRITLRWIDNPDMLKVHYCRPSSATLTFRNLDGIEQRFRWTDIVDFIPGG